MSERRKHERPRERLAEVLTKEVTSSLEQAPPWIIFGKTHREVWFCEHQLAKSWEAFQLMGRRNIHIWKCLLLTPCRVVEFKISIIIKINDMKNSDEDRFIFPVSKRSKTKLRLALWILLCKSAIVDIVLWKRELDSPSHRLIDFLIFSIFSNMMSRYKDPSLRCSC